MDVIVTILSNPAVQSLRDVLELALLVLLIRVVNLMREQIKDLHEWHEPEVDGQPGFKVWYQDHRLSDHLDRVGAAVDGLNGTVAKAVERLAVLLDRSGS